MIRQQMNIGVLGCDRRFFDDKRCNFLDKNDQSSYLTDSESASSQLSPEPPRFVGNGLYLASRFSSLELIF